MPDDHEPAEDDALDQDQDADDELYNTVVVRGLDPEGHAVDMGDLAPRNMVKVFGIPMRRHGVQNALTVLPFVAVALPLLATVGSFLYYGNIDIADVGAAMWCAGTGAVVFTFPFNVASLTAFRRGYYSSAIALAMVPPLVIGIVTLLLTLLIVTGS